MSSDADRLNVVLAARDREFQRVMDRVIRKMDRLEQTSRRRLSGTSRNFDRLASRMQALLPALAPAALIAGARSVAASLDEIGKTADRLGLTTDALQELRVAAVASGVSQQTIDMAMQRFGRRLAEARRGTGEAADALEEMDIRLVNLDGSARSMESVLDDVADAMSQVENQTDRNRLAMRLFDSEGVALVNMLRDGSAGLREMREEAHAAGAIIDEALIREAEEAQSQIDLMSTAVRANLSVALMQLMPILLGMAEALATGARWVGEFINQIRRLDPDVRDLQDFEAAIDEITAAMVEEVTQAQTLRREIAQNNTMSRQAAITALEEARSRRENIQVMIDEARARLFASEAFEDLTERIRDYQIGMRDARERINDPATNGRNLEAARRTLERLEGQLRDVLETRRAMVQAMSEGVSSQNAEIAALDELIARLNEGLQSASGETVDVSQNLENTLELSDRLAIILSGLDMSGIVGQAEFLASRMGVSLERATAIANLPLSGPLSQRDVLPGPATAPSPTLSFGLPGANVPRFGNTNLGFNGTGAPTPDPVRSSSGGGNSALSERNALLEEGRRIYDQTRTAAEQYGAEVANLDMLLAAGAISEETHLRAMRGVAEEYGNLSGLQDDLKNSILDFAMGATGAFDQLAQSIKRAAFEYLLFGSGPLAGLFGGGKGSSSGLGSLLGGLLSFDGGGFTGHGARVGGIDGKGGFPAILHPNESIIDHTKQSAGNGQIVVVVRPEEGELLRPLITAEAKGAARVEVERAAPATVSAAQEVTRKRMLSTKRL